MEPEDLTAETFDQWRHANPVTLLVFRMWEAQRQSLLEEFGAGRTVNMDSSDNTLMLSVLKQGQIQGMDQLLNTTFSDE